MLVDNIRRLCKERGLSVTEFEKQAGIGNGLVGKWATRSPTVDSLKKVMTFFDVSIDELLSDVQEDDTNRTVP